MVLIILLNNNMPSALTPEGFNVSVLPQLQAIDPRQFATDPSQFSSGLLDSNKVMSAFAALKQQRAQMAEDEATRGDRLANIKALSQMNVLKAAADTRLQDPRIGAELGGLNLKTATDKGTLDRLPKILNFQDLQREAQTQQVESDILNFDEDYALKRETARINNLQSQALTAKYKAEAARDLSLAGQSGIEISEGEKTFQRNMANIAAVVGVTPEVVRQIYNSDPETARELSLFSEKMQKHEFFTDPFDTLTPNLRAKLDQSIGPEGTQKLRQYVDNQIVAHGNGMITPGNINLSARPRVENKDGSFSTLKSISFGTPQGEVLIPTITPQGVQLTEDQAIEQFKQTGQHLGVYKDAESATTAAKAISERQGKDTGPRKLKVNADGTIIGSEAPKEEKPAAEIKKDEKENGRSVGASAKNLASLLLLSSGSKGKSAEKVLKGAAKLSEKLWKGRASVISKAGKAVVKRGVGAVAAPVAIVDAANDILGSIYSKKYGTENMTALEGIAAGATAPSFDEQAAGAKYDEVRHRIQSIIQDQDYTNPKVEAELEDLIKKQDMLWSALQKY